MQTTGWILTHKDGRVIHFSIHDGWHFNEVTVNNDTGGHCDRKGDGWTLLGTTRQEAPQALAPPRIYLQVCNAPERDAPFSDHEGVTWCTDMIDETDVAYVRADLAAAPAAVAPEAARCEHEWHFFCGPDDDAGVMRCAKCGEWHNYSPAKAQTAAPRYAPPAEPTREPVILEVKRGRFCPHCNPCLHDDDCLRPSEIAKRAADDGVRGFPHAAPAAEPVAQQPPPRHAAGCHIWDGDDCDCFLSQPEAPPTQDDDLVARIESRSRGRTASGDALIVPLDVLHAEAERIRELEAKNGSLRELMNCYNLGGWTDAERLQSERDEARRELAASRERERALREMFKDGYVLALYDDHGSQVNAWHSPEEFIATLASPDSAAEQGEAK